MNGARIILDTCIVSYLMKGGPLAEAYVPHIQGRLLAISFITVGENVLWSGKQKLGRQKAQGTRNNATQLCSGSL